MTGLTQQTSEAIQVQNYGIGGHYVPHWDHRIKRETPFNTTGNRIATTLFYVHARVLRIRLKINVIAISDVRYRERRCDGLSLLESAN